MRKFNRRDLENRWAVDMMFNVVDIVRIVADEQKGIKRIIGKILNRACWKYYKLIRKDGGIV